MNKIGIFGWMLAAAFAGAQDTSQPQSATQPTTPQASTQAPPQESAPPKPPAPQVARTNSMMVSNAPTENDMYCSGFVLKQGLQRAGRVVAGWDSPFQTRFVADANLNGVVYLDRGAYSKDQQFLVVRPRKDVNNYELTPGQHKNLRAAGQYFMELGRIRVFDVQKNIGLARAEFSCEAIEPGDIVVPWMDRPIPQFRREAQWDFFPQANGKTSGTLIMGREFDGLAAQRGKVYINVGANQGVKAGDYFRVTRTYRQMAKDPADHLSTQASIVEYGHLEPVKHRPTLLPGGPTGFDDLPRKSIGELMVLYTTPTTATATVTRSWEQLQAGDGVEMMEEPPPAPAPAPVVMNPPTVNCTATPSIVHVGENSTIRCTGQSPDNRDMTYSFATDAGAVTGRGENAVLNTATAQPGVANIIATVSDDRGQTGSATTRVTIQPAESAEASPAGMLAFKPNGGYVNNQAKAILDQLALRMQREAGSSALMVGYVSAKEPAALALTRATNAMNYLIKEKGIDVSRVQVANGGSGDAKVDAWFVPAGAQPPQIAPTPPPPQQ